MGWIICILIFIATTMAFAIDDYAIPNSGVVRVINSYNNYSSDTCLSNPNINVQEVCKKMRQAEQANAAKSAPAPSVNAMPAWQQALKPKTTTQGQNTTTTQNADVE